jgi:bacterioferritin-associated ferredoxin
MYVCVCHGVTDRQICRAVDQGARSLGEVQMQLPVGACCGRCVDSAQAVIDQAVIDQALDHQTLTSHHAHCEHSHVAARAAARISEPALA